MSEKTLPEYCGCVYCLWRRALAKAMAEKMDAEIMREIEGGGDE